MPVPKHNCRFGFDFVAEFQFFFSPRTHTVVMAPPAKKTESVQKAADAKKAVLKGTVKFARKFHSSATFRRPKTLALPRNPKYLRSRRLFSGAALLDHYQVIKYPLNTESAMRKIESHNTLVFICDIRSNKKQIKNAVKELYDVDAAKVNTLIRPDGLKKAYVRLVADADALDVANKIGFI
ncbi:hypothetical protein BATDEDRAFT_24589 [Batrachochytrium dendrobatidis JAM81]|uniref:Large ribosomal subunit protein uL23 N-terminal domain-containing protein n=2 Tax=Batrachochytrium dendrobatidis TaxID=109871 RepID=F4P163_BATDJ|nr:ribosomal 60S subunit protein L25 [Batrachochytrium dendrobatidis JAM81]EGF80996.1 hypothetical protein BATDEDRAFT_24589 [Batrachochytrium dendrobatidis JAM81]KAK5668897.1 60S ribosomal protein L25 [Batrachochytrium dendrobatidis]OAJ41809.1 ribosomal protein L23 [Batrachochytrium dendrobatidis JEL423]|eukprot:XP_006678490.1 hypothetical protein BATDEDRAFT_24589 [Batrachochytrium dendrobatidis JAM81]